MERWREEVYISLTIFGYQDEKRKRDLWGRRVDLRWKRPDPFKCC